MASRQYFEWTGTDKNGKPRKGQAVIVGARELTEAQAVEHIQKTNFPRRERIIKTAKVIDSSKEAEVRAGAPAKVKTIFNVMDEAENEAKRRAAEVAAQQAAASEATEAPTPEPETPANG